MRHLLNTLYVMTEDAYLSLDGENVVVQKDGAEMSRFPLHGLEGIQSFSYRGVSPSLMGACAERDIDLCFMRPNGKFIARVCGRTKGNVLLRKTQYSASENTTSALDISRNMLIGKLFNSRWILERATRDHPLSVNMELLKEASTRIQNSISKLRFAETIESLRGIEGEAAAEYFSVFDELILNKDESFRFTGRNRRPPLDCINAMLSFAYSLLTSNCSSALEACGLDPYVGFIHSIRPGRESLALDLMEELRSVIADRAVLYCVNNRIIHPSMFQKSESGAVILTDKGRKTFLKIWQERKKEILTHPFLKEKVPWGLVPHVQAQLLSRHFRGDLDSYPPFLWK